MTRDSCSDDLAGTCQQTSGGVRLEVKAHPGARANRIAGVHDGALRVQVTAAPEKGKANRALRKVLADCTGCAARDVELLLGEHAARKTFLLRGIDIRSVLRSLEEHMD